MQEDPSSGETREVSSVGSWTRVDRALEAARRRLAGANSEEELQSTGILCREVTISLAQAVYDPRRHAGTAQVSETDAVRMLEAYFSVELAGGPNEELRQYAKACLKLANALQHKRTATPRDAALVTEAVTALVSLVGLVATRHDNWLTESRYRNRDSAERDFVGLLLSVILDRHPLFNALGLRAPSMTFADASVSVTVKSAHGEATATVERVGWWKPSTVDGVQRIVDELMLRIVAILPPIDSLTYTPSA
jgi:hypothetical protein